jgi:glycerol uptake facilitator-like aquaporin
MSADVSLENASSNSAVRTYRTKSILDDEQVQRNLNMRFSEALKPVDLKILNQYNKSQEVLQNFLITPNGLLIKKLFAEFLGMSLFVCILGFVVNEVGNPYLRPESGKSQLNNSSYVAALVCYSLANGLTIAVIIAAFGHISGGYFNPAMVIASYVIGSFDGSMFVAFLYIVAQCAGACFGSAWMLLLPAVPPAIYAQLPVTLPGVGITVSAAFGCEFVTTFFLAITVFSVSKSEKYRDSISVIVGMVVALNVLAAAYISGGSMNPARSLGPALLNNTMQYHYVYWLGPVGGALLAAALQIFIIPTEPAKSSVSFLTPLYDRIVAYGLTPTGASLKKMFVEFLGVAVLISAVGFVVNEIGNPSLRDTNVLGNVQNAVTPSLICYCFINGMTIATLIAVLGPYSGGYFNPAMVIAALVAGSFDGSPLLAVGYIIAELLGGIFGSALLLTLPPNPPSPQSIMPTTFPGNGISAAQAFGCEFLITFFLVTAPFKIDFSFLPLLPACARLVLNLLCSLLPCLPSQSSRLSPSTSPDSLER